MARPTLVSEAAAHRIAELHAAGSSRRKIAARLEAEGVAAPADGWSPDTVRRVVERLGLPPHPRGRRRRLDA